MARHPLALAPVRAAADSRAMVRLFVIVFLLAIVVVACIDAWLGAEATFFNAWETLKRLTGNRTPGHVVIWREEALGPWALPLAAAVLFGGAAVIAGIVVAIVRLVRG